MARKNIITNQERRIRLTQYDRDRLYSLLLDESGLKERRNECKERLTKYCEKLLNKYLFTEEVLQILPGSARIGGPRIDSFSIVFKVFDLRLPERKKGDLIKTIDDFVTIKLNSKIPDIFNELCIWNRRNPAFFTETRFAARIKKLANNNELMTLRNLLCEYIESIVNINNFLIEERSSVKSSWIVYHDFGKYFTLGTLYDHNREYGIKMKYEILLLEDEDEENKEVGKYPTLDKHPKDFSIEQNIERIKFLLNL